jgi:hypothetical protein
MSVFAEIRRWWTDLTREKLGKALKERWNKEPEVCFCQDPGKHPRPVSNELPKGRRSVFDTSRRSCYIGVRKIEEFMSKNVEETLTAAVLEELKSLQAVLRRQWGYMRTMISSEGREVLKGSGNLVSATGYAVCNALVSSSRCIQENMDQSGEEDDAISTPPEEMTLITATKDTHGACDGAKPMVDARVTAKLAELEAMEREEKRRRVIREWTQQEIQIELASAKLKKVFSSHNNGIQLTVSRIRNFLLNTDDAVSLNLGELLHLELLQTDLRDQFHGMTTEWDIRRTDPEAELAFSEVENCVGIATRAVEKALRDSDAFLEVQYLTELELHRFDETVSDEAEVNCCVNEGVRSARK